MDTTGSSSSSETITPHLTNGVADHNGAAEKEDHLADWESFDACSSPGNAQQMLTRRRRRKDESLTGTLRSWLVQHQIGISINLLVLLILTHVCFPRARRRTRTFFELSYYNPSDGRYTQGPNDYYFIAYCIVVLTGLRAGVMTYVLMPLAEAAGLQRTKPKVRFAEQAWLLLYYTVIFPLGMYIMYRSNYWLNFREMWTNFPTRSMDGMMKWYYLAQSAFWLQQILVVHIEERRKDHWQMLTHHIVTCILLQLSYGYYQTKVGNVILCLMDVVDIVLPAAKMLKYTGFQTLCDVAFGIFIAVWFLARHVIYLAVCWSIWTDVPQVMHYGCYSSATGTKLSPEGGSQIMTHALQPFLDPDGPICFNPNIRYAFLALLLFLQGITCMWFILILRVAWRVLKGDGADDSRSDDESESLDEAGSEDEEDPVSISRVTFDKVQPSPLSLPLQPVEQTVGVDGLNLRQRRAASPRYRSNRKPGSHAGALSITGHSDRKELLGRIGCDKPT